ncbi:GntR family transcriptional regulator [Fulvimarina sp. 2208YS6-2-32]|uniref:GntR family transcriptional regulator n=1 Tax=Fulvimarina uroteuthidis TaxID=3098149 RepID=A0ABU5I510_9HYPH|nr:GntR family transcriptional regulator [Fulvimarina sp. 2208YS6-2-32]MDY8109884.1 GntR family transcriptional regulator [Fulvimarina sp. 2208YS6-2-32]
MSETASPLVLSLAGRLSELIRVGDIKAGEKLATQALADRFGVSRSPVRDALTLLQERGVIEQQPNRGFFAKEVCDTEGDAAGSEPLPHDALDVYQRLAEDWLTDRIPSDVSEQMLRERYGLTKAQVSDILVRAAREGWAERKQGYGWRLLPVAKTPEAFEQIYRFRMMIEPAAMLEPDFRVDARILAEQRRIQEKMLESDIERLPADRLLDNGSNFHEELMRMSGNPFMHMSLVRVNRMRRLLEYRSKVDRPLLSVQCSQHLEILSALERNEIIEASYLMRKHLGGALTSKSPLLWARDALSASSAEAPGTATDPAGRS